jgi:hypothetical protein
MARDPGGGILVHRLKGLPAALEQNTDQIDDRIGVPHRGGNGGIIADIGHHRRHLPDIAHGTQEIRAGRITHRDAHDPALFRQPLDQMPADKARTAEYRDLFHRVPSLHAKPG